MPQENPCEDMIITFKPDATEEEENTFLDNFARAIYSMARHVGEEESEHR
jgi:hypothetical protein